MKCIIVDDSLDNLYICKKFVTEVDGFTAETFLSPTRALEHLTNNAVDLIILDWDMPVMNGMAFIDEFMKIEVEEPRPKIMMCTGENSLDIVRNLLAKGVVGYVTKPFSREQIHKQILAIKAKG